MEMHKCDLLFLQELIDIKDMSKIIFILILYSWLWIYGNLSKNSYKCVIFFERYGYFMHVK